MVCGNDSITNFILTPGPFFKNNPCGRRPPRRFSHFGWYQKKHRFNVCTLFPFLNMTNISPDIDQISSESARFYTKKYLSLGELLLDTSSAFMSQSEYFKRS